MMLARLAAVSAGDCASQGGHGRPELLRQTGAVEHGQELCVGELADRDRREVGWQPDVAGHERGQLRGGAKLRLQQGGQGFGQYIGRYQRADHRRQTRQGEDETPPEAADRADD